MISPEKKIEIPENDPFKNDLLSRKDFAESLVQLFKNSPEGPVISLNAQWGEGKTTFVEMWSQKLKNEGGKPIYLNTFDFDYVNDPFLLLASCIYQNFKDYFPKEEKEFGKTFLIAAGETGKHLASWGIKEAVKVATAGVINDEFVKKTKFAIDKSNNKTVDLIKSKIEGFNKKKKH